MASLGGRRRELIRLKTCIRRHWGRPQYISAEALPFVESAGELILMTTSSKTMIPQAQQPQQSDKNRHYSVAIPVIALIIIHALRRKGRSVDELGQGRVSGVYC